MAEFCKECAIKYGFKNDKPDLCEGCGRTFERKGLFEIIKALFN